MSSGKEAARDLRYGRQGGRWAPAGYVADSIAVIQRTRLTALRHDAKLSAVDYADVKNRKWPAESLPLWQHIAANHPDHPQHAHALEVAALARR